jgi:hypothetical protein
VDTLDSEPRSLFAAARDRSILVGGLQVAAVVGTVLNAINQGDRLLAMQWGDVVWWKIGLTYLVPFCVSVYSAARIRRFSRRT